MVAETGSSANTWMRRLHGKGSTKAPTRITSRTLANPLELSPASVSKKSSILKGAKSSHLTDCTARTDLSSPFDSNGCVGRPVEVEEEKRDTVVKFGNVEIREYSLAIGHCSVPAAGGVPLGISWNYKTLPSEPIEEYESERFPYRRHHEELVITNSDRVNRFLTSNENGCTSAAVKQAVAECDRVLKNRDQSFQQIRRNLVLEERVSSIKGMFGLNKRGKAIDAA